MNAATYIESHQSPVVTPAGELLAVPANDNKTRTVGYVAPPNGWLDRGMPAWPWVSRETLGAEIGTSPQPLPPVIALSGPAGSGKSTVSTHLVLHYGYSQTKFAKPLKDMCRALGMTDAMIEGERKETPEIWLGGRTPRHVMQTLGTEWGRDCMGEDFWVDMWANRAMLPTVVDDCRFPNEAAAVRRMGGKVVRIVGRGGIAGSHASEAGDFIADEVICNDGSIADLHDRVRQVLEGWV